MDKKVNFHFIVWSRTAARVFGKFGRKRKDRWNTSTPPFFFCIFAVAKKGWPAALGTDEGVRPPTGI